MRKMKPKSPELTEVFRRAGTLANVAAHLKISRAAVSIWKKVPLRHLRAIGALTGMKPEEMRPDLYAGWDKAA